MSDDSLQLEDILLSRRGALKVGAAAMLAPFASRVSAQEKPKPVYEGPLKEFSFTDQYGKEFKPQDVLAGQPHLLLFGYEGCPFCEGKITKTAATVQQKTDLPVVVVTIHAETDHDKLEEYAGKYSDLGVRQLAGEGKEDGKKAYAAAKDVDPSARALHLLIARNDKGEPSNESAIAAHLKTGQPYDAKNPDSHTPMIMLCDASGKVIDKKFAAIDAKNVKAREDIGDAFNTKLLSQQPEKKRTSLLEGLDQPGESRSAGR